MTNRLAPDLLVLILVAASLGLAATFGAASIDRGERAGLSDTGQLVSTSAIADLAHATVLPARLRIGENRSKPGHVSHPSGSRQTTLEPART
jgi:hypothetical protein